MERVVLSLLDTQLEYVVPKKRVTGEVPSLGSPVLDFRDLARTPVPDENLGRRVLRKSHLLTGNG